jgi:TP901 family phage tail tape measure protein
MTAEAAKFAREMAMVKGLLETVTTKELDQLTQAAKEMSVAFGEAPTNIAKGLQVLARAGVQDVNDQINLMTNGIRLAKVEGIGLEESNRTLITMVNLWQDSYDNVEKYANALAHAANISPTTVPQLGTALKYFGGAAAENWTPEESLAAVSSMASKGVQGSMAGTALRSFSSFLVRETPKSGRALKELGLTFDDFWQKTSTGAKEKMIPLQDIILKISQAAEMKGMGRGDLTKVLSEFGSPRMVQQYVKLFPTPKELDEGTWQLANFNKRMGETYDISDRFNIVLGTAQEKFKQTIAAVQVLGINIGSTLLPGLSLTLDIFKGLVGILSNTPYLANALAIALTALAAAGGLVIVKWGWGLIANTWTEATSIFSDGIRKLTNNLVIESLMVDKNTAAYTANAAARNLAQGGAGAFPVRNADQWAMTRAEKAVKDAGGGHMTAGHGFFGSEAGAMNAYMAGSLYQDVVGGMKQGGIRGVNAPLNEKKWEGYAGSILGFNVDTIKGLPEEGVERQKAIMDGLALEHRNRQNELMRARNVFADLKLEGGNKEDWETAKRNLQVAEMQTANSAAVMADYNNIIGSEGKGATARGVISDRWKGIKKGFAKPGTLRDNKYFGDALKYEKTVPGGAMKVGEEMIPLAATTQTFSILDKLPLFIGELPLLGVVLAAIAIPLVALVAFFSHLNGQIAASVKKAKELGQEADKLEQTANKLQSSLDKSKPGKPGYLEDLEALHKTNKELDTMYRKIATVNREKYNAQAWQPWKWPEFRSQEGPSWYASLGTSIAGTVNPGKWKSGENVSKMLGFEPLMGGAASWMSGPQEQMLSEAYGIEKKRQNAIAILDNTHNSQMNAMHEQHKKGRFASEQEYLQARNSEVDKYNKKRVELDRKYDRQTSRVVGPQNVDATRRLYQMEERLKTSRLQMINAIMKMLDVIMKIVMLPLTIFGGGAFKATGGEGVADKTENLNDQINRMAKEMEQAAKRMENFAQAINNIANPILYTIYVMSHFVAFLKGLIQWAIHPMNWLTKSPPNPIPESYKTWTEKNKEGKDHYDPSKLTDNSLKKGYDWVASGDALHDTYAGIMDIPNKVRGEVHKTQQKVVGAYQRVVGAPAAAWNRIAGPKAKYTPEERRRIHEARKAGKKPGEYFPTESDERTATYKQEQGITDADKMKHGDIAPTAQMMDRGDVNPSIEEQRKQGLKYKLHSPLTLMSGMTGFLTGAAKIVFPQLDPKVFTELAEKAGKTVGGLKGAAGETIVNIGTKAGITTGASAGTIMAGFQKNIMSGIGILRDVGGKSLETLKSFPSYYSNMIKSIKSLTSIEFWGQMGQGAGGIFGGKGGGGFGGGAAGDAFKRGQDYAGTLKGKFDDLADKADDFIYGKKEYKPGGVAGGNRDVFTGHSGHYDEEGNYIPGQVSEGSIFTGKPGHDIRGPNLKERLIGKKTLYDDPENMRRAMAGEPVPEPKEVWSGGLFGKGGKHDLYAKKDSVLSWWDEGSGKRADLEHSLFGKEGRKTGKMMGGIFGSGGHLGEAGTLDKTIESFLGKDASKTYNQYMGKGIDTVLGGKSYSWAMDHLKKGKGPYAGRKGGLAGLLGREGEGDYKPTGELWEDVVGKGKEFANTAENTIHKFTSKMGAKDFSLGSILGGKGPTSKTISDLLGKKREGAGAKGGEFSKQFGDILNKTGLKDIGSKLTGKFGTLLKGTKLSGIGSTIQSGIGGLLGGAGKGIMSKASSIGGIAGDLLGNAGSMLGGAGKGIMSKAGGLGGKVGDLLGGLGGKAGGLGGKAGGMLGKAGGLLGGLGGKAGGLLGKAGGMLGKAGGMAGMAGKLGGKLLKKIPGIGAIASAGSLIGDIMSGQATAGSTISNLIGTVGGLIPGFGTLASIGGDLLGGGIDALGGLLGGKGGKGLGGLLGGLGPLGGLLGGIFGFKKHSPFTVWKGQGGSMPTGSSDFSVKFPELDAEKLAAKVKDAGAHVAAQNTSGGVTIQNLVVERASESPEEIQRVIRTGLVDLMRELEGT